MPRNPDQLELFQAAADKGAAQALSVLAGKIVSYDHLTQTATAQPCAEDLPTLEGPVGFLGGGGWRQFGGLAAGDDCLLLLCARDPGKLFSTGDNSDGDVAQPFGGLWPVIVPMKLSLPNVYLDAALSDDLRLGKDDGSLEIIFGETLQLGGVLAADPVVLLSHLTTTLAALAVWANAHVHSGGGSGPPATPYVPTASGSATVLGVP